MFVCLSDLIFLIGKCLWQHWGQHICGTIQHFPLKDILAYNCCEQSLFRAFLVKSNYCFRIQNTSNNGNLKFFRKMIQLH